jgi:glycosyltransferase involved in cell wall biosynthesis
VSLGIPIISYDCSHGPKEIINNENGYLVELKNINQFSAAIDSLMNRSFDSFNIRAKAAELYFEDKIINQWLGVL